jgi:NADH-quinone oxidoreductase subunit A
MASTDRFYKALVLHFEQLMHLLFGKTWLRGLFRIGSGMFAEAVAFDKDLRLQQQIVGSGLALDVVHRFAVLHIRVETEDHRPIPSNCEWLPAHSLTLMEPKNTLACSALTVCAHYIQRLMPDNYFARYLPFLMHAIVVLAIPIGMVVLSAIVGTRRRSRMKDQAYECGITPTGDARGRFSVKFYLVAMLFILFDIEAIFLYPWAVILKELKMFGFYEMLVYILIVLVGFFYIWKKKVLNWAHSEGDIY